ncbi:Forkhead transcription factor [Neophaeococcomyces mojaviensis]|uniref:Forkhead transcription factor n=1 Tax=Neophaeococcomyces mojaviensis TaxID=3383035 RepID=A0ACC3A245_9EURO|nr:Forkhead transcription factor [Knufia sp. JES_112]
MSSTRQPPPIQIYQDFPEPPQPMPPQNRPRPQLAPSAMPLQPIRNVSQYPPLMDAGVSDMVFKQPLSTPQQFSPLKSQHFSPPNQNYQQMHMMPAIDPHMHTGLPETAPFYTDSLEKRMSLPSSSSQPLLAAAPMPMQPMFTTFNSNFDSFEQENFHMPIPMQENFVDFPDPSVVRRGGLKRSYSETATAHDRPFKKTKQDDEEVTEIPAPEDMPLVEDDGRKPPYSYAQMIGMAILRAPGRRLTLANIYDWIANTFQFYREDPKTGWHNSIRHNLSLNKAFIKQERPKSDAGKGSYWVIQPGMEAQFFKDKPRKAGNVPNMTVSQGFGTQPSMQAMAQPLSEALLPRSWIIQSQTTMEPIPEPALQRPQTAPALPDLSSDATVPASDPALQEEEVLLSKEIPDLAPPSMLPPPSSPPIINSSPPVAPRLHGRTISSPANITRPPTKRHKRNITGMDDSGYFSSLESSARRPRPGVMLTSELGGMEKPKNKRGRAEEEIARIRSSSRDITPSHNRFAQPPLDNARSSSPLRADSGKLDPTTPSIVFKKPQPPPQSISPNSQLRRHREAMQQFIGSPAKADDVFTGDLSFSPVSKLGTPFMPNSFEESFAVDFDFGRFGTPLASSPIKPGMSAKRASLQRSNTSAGILSDVTKRANNKLSSKTPSKIPGNITLKAPSNVSVTGSPLKKSVSTKSFVPDIYNDENDNYLFDFGSFPDENSEEGEELDISKGFSKIGSGNNTSSSQLFGKPLHSIKPALARSKTSRF